MSKYAEELNAYEEIKAWYDRLQDNELVGSFDLTKKSAALADRFSVIVMETRMEYGRDGAALKDRYKEMFENLKFIRDHSRSIWRLAVDRERRGDI